MVHYIQKEKKIIQQFLTSIKEEKQKNNFCSLDSVRFNNGCIKRLVMGLPGKIIDAVPKKITDSVHKTY
jgi:hypothetical protein